MNQFSAERTDLRGTYFYGDPENRISVSPCNNLIVRFIGRDEKLEAIANTNGQGHFRFYLPPKKKYSVEIEDRKGKKTKSSESVERGNVIEIFLKPSS